MRKICVITGSRADDSPMKPVVAALERHTEVLRIRTSGLYDNEVYLREMLALNRPDMVVLLGDRYETLVAASVAALLCIPIAHLCGGDETLGANDNIFRHAITKLSHWHFPGTYQAAQRIEKMGEDPARVFCFGYPGVDNCKDLMTLSELEQYLGHPLPKRYIVLSAHPETLGHFDIDCLFDALHAVREMAVYACASNEDSGGRAMTKRIKERCERWGAYYRESFSPRVWLSLILHSRLCVGNSSGFMIEAPALGVPVVNVGNRQAGRVISRFVTNVQCDPFAILQGIEAQLKNIYETPDTQFGVIGKVGSSIADTLLNVEIPKPAIKPFYE